MTATEALNLADKEQLLQAIPRIVGGFRPSEWVVFVGVDENGHKVTAHWTIGSYTPLLVTSTLETLKMAGAQAVAIVYYTDAKRFEYGEGIPPFGLQAIVTALTSDDVGLGGISLLLVRHDQWLDYFDIHHTWHPMPAGA